MPKRPTKTTTNKKTNKQQQQQIIQNQEIILIVKHENISYKQKQYGQVLIVILVSMITLCSHKKQF